MEKHNDSRARAFARIARPGNSHQGLIHMKKLLLCTLATLSLHMQAVACQEEVVLQRQQLTDPVHGGQKIGSTDPVTVGLPAVYSAEVEFTLPPRHVCSRARRILAQRIQWSCTGDNQTRNGVRRIGSARVVRRPMDR